MPREKEEMLNTATSGANVQIRVCVFKIFNTWMQFYEIQVIEFLKQIILLELVFDKVVFWSISGGFFDEKVCLSELLDVGQDVIFSVKIMR